MHAAVCPVIRVVVRIGPCKDWPELPDLRQAETMATQACTQLPPPLGKYSVQARLYTAELQLSYRKMTIVAAVIRPSGEFQLPSTQHERIAADMKHCRI